MRLWILSDLHLSFAETASLAQCGPIPEADICVMAGDLCRSMSLGLRWLAKNIRPHMPVVYVPGNHDFYDTSITEGLMVARAVAELGDITLLDGDEAILGDVRFTGGTLWTDYALYATQEGATERSRQITLSMDASRLRADYTRIRMSNDDYDLTRFRFLQPEDTAAIHKRSVDAITSVLSRDFGGPTVVVTHHAPHRGSIDPAYFGGDARTPSCVSDLNTLIDEYEPNLWVHGHVHQPYDYAVGRTRIVCNPKGYSHEKVGFDWSKTVEI